MPLDIFLHDIPLPEAHAAWNAALQAAGCWDALPAENIALPDALGRVTAAPVWAKLSAPHYHAAAMDGYAVRADDTAGATESAPLELRVPDQAIYVDTGDALPAHATAVVPIEAAQPMGSGADTRQPERIQIRAALPPWQHVRATGEDMVATELVLPANQRLRPVDLGALAGCGYGTVLVRRRPRVAIIPTGTELVQAGSDVLPGQIIEYNSLVLGAQVQQWGGVATRWPIVADDLEMICAAVREAAATHDLVLLNAGSSKGSEDFSARVIAALGKVCLHGVAVRPGHPVILGVLAGVGSQRPTPIVGVPGYPVSAAHTGEIFVEPLLARWLGMASAAPATVTATLTRKVLSPVGDDEYLRVSAGRVNNQIVATPLARGAGVISSLVRADGIVRIPRFSEGYAAGASVTVHLYRTAAEIDNTILHIGSLGLDPAVLEKTVGDFNAAVRPGTFDHTILDDCRTEGLTPPKTHWARRIETAPFYASPERPGITYPSLGTRVDRDARMRMQDGNGAANMFAAGEIMAGNVLGKGYAAGMGMTIGSVFGRIAGREAAISAKQ